MSSFDSARRAVTELELAERADGFPCSRFINSLVDYWQSKRRGQHLPSREDFTFETLRPWIGNISLVDVVRDPLRFRWRLIGTRIADQLGRDSTGKWFAELFDDDALAKHNEAYKASVERREPVYYRGNLVYVNKEYKYFSSVHLPLANADGDADMLLIGADFD